jgi:hypothetical protein
MTPPAWTITEDKLTNGTDGICSRVGTSQGTFSNGETRYEFRLLDDDQEVYYVGQCNEAAYWAEDGEGALIQAWKWGEYDAGAVHCMVKLDDLLRIDPKAATILAQYERQGWVGLFG